MQKLRQTDQNGRFEIVRSLLCIALLFIGLTLAGCRKEGKDKKMTAVQSKISLLEITTFPKDGQVIRDLNIPLCISFSQKIPLDDFSFSLKPDLEKWEVLWEEDGKEVTLGHRREFVGGTTYELEVRVKQGRKEIKKSVHFTAFGPSSLDLIARDEKQGILDLDTAWAYRFFCLAETGKLPAKYRSPTPIKSGTPILRQFNRIQDQLQPATLKTLKPYLVRPTHPESIFSRAYDQSRGLSSSASSLFGSGMLFAQDDPKRPKNMWDPPLNCSDKLRIWYRQGYKEKAERARYWLNNENMYESFKKLMGTQPWDDTSECMGMDDAKERKKCEEEQGGDGRLDIYIVPRTESGMNALGWCRAIWPKARVSPSFILIDQNLSDPAGPQGNIFAATLAHELFHAFQDALDAKEEPWWAEGTAVWAEDHINRDFDIEHEYIGGAFDLKKKSFITLTEMENDHHYSAYLFPYYLSTINPADFSIIGEIWQACREQSALEAVDIHLKNRAQGSSKDGFDETFKTFILTNFNDTASFTNNYAEQLNTYPWHREKIITLDRKEPHKTKITFSTGDALEPLSARYIEIKNKLDPKITPFVRFDLADFKQNEKLTIQAIIFRGGTPEVQDWSDQDEKVFCINEWNEKFDKIVLVYGSAEKILPQSPVLTIEADDQGCKEVTWTGTLTYHENINQSKKGAVPGGGSVSMSMTSSLHSTIFVKLNFTHVYAHSGGADEYHDEIVALSGSYNHKFRREQDVTYPQGDSDNTVESCNSSGPVTAARAESGQGATANVSLVVNEKAGSYSLHCSMVWPISSGTMVVTKKSGKWSFPFEWGDRPSPLDFEGPTQGLYVSGTQPIRFKGAGSSGQWTWNLARK